MNWTLISATIGGVVLNLVASEIGDVAPWLAHRILRRASRWEAADAAQAALIFGEQRDALKDVPGRISKVVFAIGRLRFGLRSSIRRGKQDIGKMSGHAWFELVTAVLMDASALYLILSPPAIDFDPWMDSVAMILGCLSVLSLAVSQTAAVVVRWRRHRETPK